jgi:hypothetical protein
MIWDEVEEGQINLVKDPLTGSYFPHVKELPKNDLKAQEVQSETVQLNGNSPPSVSQYRVCSQGISLDRNLRTKPYSSASKGNKRDRHNKPRRLTMQ